MNWKKLFRRYKRKTRLSKNFILDEVGAEIRLNHYFILLLYDYAPLFPKRGVSLYRTNTLKYAVTTSFDATSLMCPPRYGDGRFLPLTAWVVEDSSGKVEITCIGDTMDIVSPDGLSLWYKERLTGNYEITYRVQVVVENGSYDRLSDLNCFWGADDPRHPDDFFARSAWRNGEFKNYNTLDLYYVATAVMIMELRVSVNTMESIMEWTMQRLNPS